MYIISLRGSGIRTLLLIALLFFIPFFTVAQTTEEGIVIEAEDSVPDIATPDVRSEDLYQKQDMTGAMEAAHGSTKTAVKNGLWNNAATWGGAIPTSGDNVVIPAGKTVTLDVTASVATVMVNGVLRVADTADSSITTRWVLVMGTGALLQVGTEAAPFQHKFTLMLIGAYKGAQTENIMMHMGTKFLSVMEGGTIQMHGKPQVSWTKLTRAVQPGATNITLAAPVAWNVGDEIVIASSVLDPNQAEVRHVASLGGGGLVVTLDQPLTYMHAGSIKNYSNGVKTWVLDERAEVGLLTHNVKVQGDAQSDTDYASTAGFGGHIMMMTCVKHDLTCTIGKGYFSNVELYRMGQKPKDHPDAGMGRYPIHWHLVMKGGAGQYIKNSSIHRTYNRGVTIHATDYVTVDHNVVYDTVGHTIFLEDAVERFNKINYNLVLLTRKPLPGQALLPSDNEFNTIQNRTPASFWITNPNNEFIGNVAGGTVGTGFWFALPSKPLGLAAKILSQYYTGMNPSIQPLGTFSGNVAHSSMSGFDDNDGISDDGHILRNRRWNPPANVHLRDFTVYADNLGLYTGGFQLSLNKSDKVIFDNVKSADIWNEHLRFADNTVVQNSLLVANSGNGILPANVNVGGFAFYDGPGRLYDSHIVGFDQPRTTLLKNGGGAIKHANALFRGLTFDPTTPARIVLACPPTFQEVGCFQPRGGPAQTTARDLDGSLTGSLGKTVITGSPFLRTSTDTPWPNGNSSAYISSHSFAALDLSAGTSSYPLIAVAREGGGEASVSHPGDTYNLLIKGVIHAIVNEGFVYTVSFPGAILPPKPIMVYTHDARAGDDVVVKITPVGLYKASSVNPIFPTTASLAALKASASNAQFSDAQGNLWLHLVTASALNDEGTSIAWTPLPSDISPPLAFVSDPIAGDTVFGTVAVVANAWDNVGVVGVQFKLDGANLGAEDKTAPYSVDWNTISTSVGAHTIYVAARDAAGHTTTNSINVKVEKSGLPTGVLDGLAPDTAVPTLRGWAYDPKVSSTSISVHVYVDGTPLPAPNPYFAGAVLANDLRPDVNTAKGITGNHGFNWPIPAKFQGGTHDFHVYAINTQTGQGNPQLTNSPKTIDVSGSKLTVTLTASPTSIASGQSSTLAWSSTNATSCTASGAWSGAKATSGSQSTGALTANKTYTITCTGTGGTASDSATITVSAHTPKGEFDLALVTALNKHYLTGWAFDPDASSSALTIELYKGGTFTTGTKVASLATSLLAPVINDKYHITGTHRFLYHFPDSDTISDLRGEYHAYALDVGSGARTELTSSPRVIATGASCTLDSLTVPDGFTGTFYAESKMTPPVICALISQPRTCNNGTLSGTATYNKATCKAGTPAPTVTLTASPASVASGGSSTLTWKSTNATSCTASGAWTGAKAVNGSQSTGTLTATKTYTITCTGTGGSASDSATVTVSACIPEHRWSNSIEHVYVQNTAAQVDYLQSHGYTHEGVAFIVRNAPASGTVPLERLRGPYTYLSTVSPSDRPGGYDDEGNTGYVFSSNGPGRIPLHGWSNGGTSDPYTRFLSINKSEGNNLPNNFHYEGEVAYVPSSYSASVCY